MRFGFSHSGCDGTETCAAFDIHDKVNDERIDNRNTKFNTTTEIFRTRPTYRVCGDVVSDCFNVSDARRTSSGHRCILNAKFVVNDFKLMMVATQLVFLEALEMMEYSNLYAPSSMHDYAEM
jgi:hypothetical protein